MIQGGLQYGRGLTLICGEDHTDNMFVLMPEGTFPAHIIDHYEKLLTNHVQMIDFDTGNVYNMGDYLRCREIKKKIEKK